MALTVFLVAVCFLDWFSEPSTSRYVWLARALVEDGSTTISRFVENAAGTADIARVAGPSGDRYVPGTYPGVSLALLPVAILGRISWDLLPDAGRVLFGDSCSSWIVLLAILLVTGPLLALSAALLVRFARREGVSDLAARSWVIGMLLGTPLVYYSARLHEAAIVTVLEALLLLLVAAGDSLTPRRSGIGIGLCLGLLDLVNPLAALVSGCAVLMILGVRPLLARLAWVALGVLGPELLLRAYLFVTFGSPFASPYRFLVAEGIGGVWLTLGTAGLIREMIRVIPEVAWGISFGIRGVFVFAPITLLALIVCVRRSGSDRYARAALAAVAVNVAVVWTFVHGVWAGGTSWGPRYLLPCLPWLFAGAVRSERPRGLFLFVAASVFVTCLGLQLGPAQELGGHLLYFFLAGPTTPVARYVAWVAETVWVPAKLASGMMNPSSSGQYFAYTHVSGWASWSLLALGLWWTWAPRPRGD